MPKPIINNRINQNNVYGRVIVHDDYLNQAVTTNSSPTFANIFISGDANVNGNLYVDGNVTTLDTDVVQLKDNIIVINYAETGSGITLNQGGIEIERGILENVRIVYEESSGVFKAGLISNMFPVALRENAPIDGGFFVWNDSLGLLEATNTLDLPLHSTNTENSTSSSTGSITTLGGVGIAKDMFIDGSININDSTQLYSDNVTFNISTPVPINFITPRINIEDGTKIYLGSSVLESITSDLTISSSANINLSAGNSVNIPENTKLYLGLGSVFSSNGNLIMQNSSAINLNSGFGVNIPQNIPIIFGDGSNQRISGNVANDLILEADNNIFLDPGNGKDVRIPSDSALKLGNTGNQKIFSNTSDNLVLTASSNIVFDTSVIADTVSFSSVATLSTTSYDFYITNTSGDIVLSDSVKINGVLNVFGDSNVVNADLIVTNGTIETLRGSVGDGSVLSTLTLNSSSIINGKNLLDLNAQYDTVGNYVVGRGYSTLNEGRIMTFNMPSYSDYSSTGAIPKISFTTDNCNTELFSVDAEGNFNMVGGGFSLTSTEDSYSSTTGSFIISGGLGLAKNLYSDGEIVNSVDSTSALLVRTGADSHVFGIDTNQRIVNSSAAIHVITNNTSAFSVNSDFIINTVDSKIESNIQTIINDSTVSINSSTGSLIIKGGVGIMGSLNAGSLSSFASGINMTNTKITNLLDPVDPQDAATKNYVDLVKSGLDVKDSVVAATVTDGNLATAFITGSTVDNYVLSLGDRILIKNQINPVENGIYIVTNSTPTRSDDMPNGDYGAGSFVFVKYGSVNDSLGWICNSNSTAVVGTDPINFTEFTGVGNLIAGDGLYKTGNVLDVLVDNSSIEIDTLNNQLRIKNTALGTGLTGGSGSQIETSYNQSHVTMLGTINTGVWNGSVVQVPYGGTGVSSIQQGCLVFGNDTNPLDYNTSLFFDSANYRLCIGGTDPQEDLHIKNTDTVTLLLESDTDNANPTSRPEIKFSYANGAYNNFIGISRVSNDYATNVLPDSTVISNEQNAIHFATQNIVRMTVSSDGNIIIPNTNLDAYTISCSGPVTINNTTNATSNTEGGSLTIAGGASVTKDFYIGGDLYLGGAIANEKMVLSSTEGSLNTSSGSLRTYGGITILTTYDAVDLSNGGSILTLGGASINKSLLVGGSIIGYTDAYVNNIYLTSSTISNYIMSPDLSRTTDSFMPLNFTLFNGTKNIATISTSGVLISDALKIGDLGYNFTWNTSNNYLLISPDQNLSTMIIGTSGNKLSHLVINGFNSGNVMFNASTSNIQLTNWSTSFSNTSGSKNITISKIDDSGILYINSLSGASSIVVGEGGSSETNFVLSSKSGSDTVTFTPNSTTNSSLVVSSNVDSQFNGDVDIMGTIGYDLGGVRKIVSNTSTAGSLWVYLGKVTSSFELDIYDSNDAQTKVMSGGSGIVNKSVFGSPNGTEIKLYTDSGEYFLFAKLPILSDSVINLTYSNGDAFDIISEGTGAAPNGVVSGYTGSWVNVTVGNLNVACGNLDVKGYLNVYDNVIEVNYSAGSSRSTGVLFNRYLNDIVTNDIPQETDILPDQSLVPNGQIKFSTSANSSDNYYNGWYLQVGSELARITDYNGALRVANLSSTVTTTTGNIADLFNKSECGLMYSETGGSFLLAYTPEKAFSQHVLANLTLNDLNSQKGIFSSSITTGGIYSNASIYGDTTLNINSGASIGNYLVLSGTTVDLILDSSSGNSTISVDDFNIFSSAGTLAVSSTSGNELMVNTGSISVTGALKVDSITNYSSSVTINSNGQIELDTSGNILLTTSSEGSIEFFTNTGFNYLTANSSGNILIKSTESSYSSSSGGLILSSGLGISNTTNSTSDTSGGALTVAGGASIRKDLYIGGDLIVDGNVSSTGNATSPSLNVSNTSNCSFVEYTNNNMITTNTRVDLWASFTMTPNSSGLPCQFEIDLPNRTTNFTTSSEALVFITGYDSSFNALFNTIGYGVVGTTRAIIKFHSNSTSSHFLSVKVNYIAN